jgi:hypothetical protein
MVHTICNPSISCNRNFENSEENIQKNQTPPPKRFGVHHSFDADLALELKSIDLAVLVHHLQFWIRHNAELGRNFHEGKTWTYQTLKEITAHFPYWTQRQIEKLINKLVDYKILMKGNFNKSAYDRTVWYAFCDEERFSIWRNRKMLEGNTGISPNGEIENAKRGNGNPQTVTPIPDHITNTKTYSSSLKVSDEDIAPDGASPPPASSEKRKKNSFLPSFEATELAREMAMEMEKGSKAWRRPNSLTPMATVIEEMITIQKRTPKEIFEVFLFAITDHFWKPLFNKTNPAKYLKEKFGQLYDKMNAPKPKKERRFAASSNDAEALKCFNKMMETAL